MTKVGEEVLVERITPIVDRVNNGNYTRVAIIHYDSNVSGPLRRVKVMSNMDNGTTSYDVEVYDHTNQVSLCSQTFTNTEDFGFSDLAVLSSPPEGIINLEINVKRNGGGSKKYAYIAEIVLYAQKTQNP